MSQPPQADPGWIAMRAQHQQECAAFARQVEADRQALYRRQEAEKEDLARRVETVKAELLRRHSQQEGAYWTRHHQKRFKASSALSPPSPQAPATVTQATVLPTSATPASAPCPTLLPKPEPMRKQSLVKTSDKHKQSTQNVTAASDLRQPAEQASLPRLVQQQTRKKAAGAPQAPRLGTNSQRRPSRKDVETVDLCSSDDDTLVEVCKADYQKKTVPAVASAPFRPKIPTATLQFFGDTFQNQAPKPTSTPIKQEEPELTQHTQGHHTSHLPQLSQAKASKLSTSQQPKNLHNSHRKPDTVAFNALSSVLSERAATAVPQYPLATPLLPATRGKEPLPFFRATGSTGATHGQEVHDISKLTVNRATILADKGPFILQQPNQNASFTKPILKRDQAKASVFGSTDGLDRSTSHADFDMEDIPLARLDIKAMLKRLGATTTDSMDVDLRSSALASCSTTKNNVQKTHLPSPSPSLASASCTPMIDETTNVLDMFKKPTLLATSRESSGARDRTVEPRVSSCSFVTAPDKAVLPQRQYSVVSQRCSVPPTSRKRKKIDLSDDEQSEYLQPSPSSTTAREKSATPLGSPLKKPLNPKGPPPPYASPISPARKKINGFGFRTKCAKTSPPTPSTPPRPSTSKAKPTSSAKPAPDTLSALGTFLSTPPSKRKAAVQAQHTMQKMMQADAAFHTEDEVFRSSERERARRADRSTTSALGTRLRSMSLTPVPVGTRFRKASTADESVYTREKFLRERSKGEDGLGKRTRAIGDLGGEKSNGDYEDLDTD